MSSLYNAYLVRENYFLYTLAFTKEVCLWSSSTEYISLKNELISKIVTPQTANKDWRNLRNRPNNRWLSHHILALTASFTHKTATVIGKTCIDRRANFEGIIQVSQSDAVEPDAIHIASGLKVKTTDLVNTTDGVKIIYQLPDSSFNTLMLSRTKGDDFLPLVDGQFVLQKDATLHVSFPDDETIGGNAPNIAEGFERLGIQTTLYTSLGRRDNRTKHIIRVLLADGLHLEKELYDGMDPQSILLVARLPDGKATRVIFSYNPPPIDHHFIPHHQPKLVFLNSTSDNYVEEYQEVIRFTQKLSIPLMFAPGTVQLASKDPIVYEAIRSSHFLFVNKEEAMDLLKGHSITPSSDMVTLLQQIKSELGPKAVSITDGVNDTYLIDAIGTIYAISPFATTSVETTGAGDAYTSGFLANYLQGYSLAECMRRGSFNSASVIQYEGAQKGLLSFREMKALAKAYLKYRVRRIDSESRIETDILPDLYRTRR